jgi:hypothetical protein
MKKSPFPELSPYARFPQPIDNIVDLTTVLRVT